MRIKGCKGGNDHNASKGNRGGKGLGAVRAVGLGIEAIVCIDDIEG